ncbi:MAG: hypothetical protein RIB52_08370, partial [Erythrobacter sp.]|uniref:hypothetical protein n=1 Tax=Erythrobacter sp. TaxID=1042 RepID=UPI0032EEE5B6
GMDADQPFDFSGLAGGGGHQVTAAHSMTRTPLREMFTQDTAQAPAPDPASDPGAPQDPWDKPDDGSFHWIRHSGAELDILV